MTMESDDDLDHIDSSFVNKVQKAVVVVKPTNDEDVSSDEGAPSGKSESDEEDQDDAGASLERSRAEQTFSDVSIKSEPDSEEDESGDAEKDALISSYLTALKSSMRKSTGTDESSTEDEVSIKSEHEEDDANVSIKSEPITESGSEQIETKDNIKKEPASKKQKWKKKSEVYQQKWKVKMEERKKKKAELRASRAVAIDKPSSKQEEELMSLVFGGKQQLVSQLATSENEDEPSKASKPGNKTNDPPVGHPEGKVKSKRRAVWHDSDDDDNEEDAANRKRNKFSREELPEQLTKERRRKEFEQVVGKPKWADLDRVREADSDEEMLQTVGHVVKGTASQGLPKGMIELKKLKNLNRETKAEGEITSICFHPTSMVAIITGKRGLVSIVTVDGVRNEKLHTILLQKMRVVCGRLSPDGNEAIFGSFRKFYHVYNLLSGQSDTLRIPERETYMMKNFRISRCGKFIASAGEFGEVHLMSAKGKEVLQTIQLRYPCQSLGFTPDSRYLLCHSNDAEVSVFSMEQRRIVNVFVDDGCVNGSCIAVCPNGQFVATGSRQGVVNLYPLDVLLTQKQPVPLKTFNNLTTYIDSLSFNATSELLAIASSTVKNAVKLIHVASRSVYRNFPVHMTHLGHVTAAEFSPSGGYLALGTKESTVLLYRVKHYPNY
uniref:Uncharacterized protein n=1 Tax=Anopheles epiroticus TaxID=199890 RepID=A0A182PD37_9DIPT